LFEQFAIGLFRFYDVERKGYITKEEYDKGVIAMKEAAHAEYAPWVCLPR